MRMSRHVEPAGAFVAEPHSQRALARRSVGWDVAQVVDHQQRSDQQSDGDRSHDATAVILSICTYAEPIVATSPKNTNTNSSPKPSSRRASARRCRTTRRRTSERRRAAATGSTATASASPAHRGDQRTTAARPSSPRPASPGPTRPGARDRPAAGVGAADAVAVVVGVVRADLDGERDDHRRRPRPPARSTPALAAAPRSRRATGTTAAGSVRGRAPSTHLFTARPARELGESRAGRFST